MKPETKADLINRIAALIEDYQHGLLTLRECVALVIEALAGVEV